MKIKCFLPGFKYFLALMTVLAISSSQAFAENLSLIEGSASGKEIVVPLNAGMNGTTLGIYALGKTSDEQILDFYVTAPSGSVVSVESISAFKKETAAQAAAGIRLAATIYGGGIAKSSIKMAAAQSAASISYNAPKSAAASSGDPTCGCLSESDIKFYVDLLKFSDPSSTRASFCEMIPDTNKCDETVVTPPDNQNTAPENGTPIENSVNGNYQFTGGAFLSFNKCTKGARPGYLIKISLSGVAAADLANNEVRLTASIRKYKGEDRASIKAKGDGKYKSPLFLGSPVYGTYTTPNQIQMISWSGKKKKKSRNVKIADYVYYGGPLLRAPLSGLSGGKGTFEVTSANEGYAICAAFAARRQNFNGYKTY